MSNFLSSSLGRLRAVAFVEGISFLLILFVTMPLKYGMDMGGPNKVVGMGHGVLFIAYILLVVLEKDKMDWTTKDFALALIASIIPFGTFWADKKLFKSPDNA